MGLFSSKQKTKQKVTPYDEGQLQSILGRLSALGGTPQEFFPGQTYAEMDPLQSEALGMREDYARSLGGMLDPTMSAWQSTLTAPDVASNPYVQGMIGQQANVLNRNLQENLLPSIQSGAIGAGQLGSSRQGVAEGIAMRGTQEALANQMADTQMQAYLSGLGQQRYGLGMAPTMMSMGTQPAEMLMGVGDIRRAEEQRGIDEAMARHAFEQDEPWQRLQRQAGLFNPLTLPYATKETRSKTSPSALQIGGQLAGLGMMGAGLYSGFGGTPPAPRASAGGYSGYFNRGNVDPFAAMNAAANYMQMYGQS